jgi:maltose alpha-D-glucosyltransferase / alpha-amylase
VGIDTEQLKELLPRQRWFGGKDRAVDEVDVIDEVVVEDGPPALVFALLDVGLNGRRQTYHAPLLVGDDGSVRDAFEDIDRLRTIGDLMVHGNVLKGVRGTMYFGGVGLDPLSPPGHESIRAVGAEQSNSSVVLDEDVIVKFYRRVESGANPDLELNRLLTNEGFEHVPPQVGEISYEGEIDGEAVSIDLALAQRYIQGAVDGWAEVLHQLNLLYDQIDCDGPPDRIRSSIETRAAPLLDGMEYLGDVTASLHVTLSREDMIPDFVPEPVDETDVREWSQATVDGLNTLLDERVPGLSELAPGIEHTIETFSSLEGELGYKTRVHADYHLGQVLRVGNEWLIIDFEGEPARPMQLRQTKSSPLRDAAGMLRSFSYAAQVAVMERTEDGSDERRSMEAWAEVWETLARERFLVGYWRQSYEGNFLPPDKSAAATMLDFFELDKALYELGYERVYRPHWLSIPLRGIRQFLERVRTQ